MAPERPKYKHKGPGVNRDRDISTIDNSPSWPSTDTSKRIKGVRAGVAAIATLFVLQTGALINRTSRVEGKAVRASIETVYHSRAQSVAPEAESPPTTAATIAPRREVRPATPKAPATTTTTLPQLTEPANEQPTCIDGWETLSDGVCITQFREYGSGVHAVRVDLKNPNISVRPSFVEGPGSLGRLRDAVEKLDAIVGINASFIVAKNPVGPMAAGGEWLSQDTTPQQVMIVLPDNTVKILPTKQALKEDPKQMKFALSGSHVLVRNGIAVTDFGPDNPGKMLKGKHRRTAVGVNGKGELIMVVMDGMNMQDLASTMAKLGVLFAINLDGGGSSGMVTEEDGKVSKGKTRPISTLLGVHDAKLTAASFANSSDPRDAYLDIPLPRKYDQTKDGRLNPRPHHNPSRPPTMHTRGRR